MVTFFVGRLPHSAIAVKPQHAGSPDAAAEFSLSHCPGCRCSFPWGSTEMRMPILTGLYFVVSALLAAGIAMAL